MRELLRLGESNDTPAGGGAVQIDNEAGLASVVGTYKPRSLAQGLDGWTGEAYGRRDIDSGEF